MKLSRCQLSVAARKENREGEILFSLSPHSVISWLTGAQEEGSSADMFVRRKKQAASGR